MVNDEKLRSKLWDIAYDTILKYGVNEVKVGEKYVDGEATGESAFVVGVTTKLAANKLDPERMIPSKIAGVKTDVQELPEIRAQVLTRHTQNPLSYHASSQHIKKYRPLQGGISSGNEAISAGTLGWYYIKNNELMPWSNSHVYFQDPFRSISEQTTVKIKQPGTHDGGTSNDYIGNLRYGFMLNDASNASSDKDRETCMMQNGTYTEASYNTADTALCQLGGGLTEADLKRTMLNFGNRVPMLKRKAEIGEKISMSSRSGVLTGTISNLGAFIKVGYDNGRYAVIADCIEVDGPIGYPGSSGGVPLCDKDNAIVGQNFAGGGGRSILCAIQHIDNGFSGTPLLLGDGDIPDDPNDPPTVEWVDRYKVKLSFGGLIDISGIVQEVKDKWM